MQKVIRLARKPCDKHVKEHGKKIKCRDIYREVQVDDKGKLMTSKCLSHGHDTKEKSWREFPNGRLE